MDALLVNARPTTPETRHLGAYETVFGIAPGVRPKAGSQAARVISAAADRIPTDRLTQDVADLRREIERLAVCLRGGNNSMVPQLPASPDSRQAELYARLTESELDPLLAQTVAQGGSLEELFVVDATLGRPGADRAIVALIGPPGAGKTTTLVKLAAAYGLAASRPCQILSTDVYRIAAADQLRSLSAILGIGCDIVDTPVALAQALQGHHTKELILIDTPGLALSEMEDGADLARLVAFHPEIDTHLVLPASMKPRDMTRAADRYQVFGPKKLIFTRMDETERYGALISEASRRSLAISFLTAGQQIPDDLEKASVDRLSALVLGAEEGTERRMGASA